MRAEKLKEKHRLFVAEFLVDLNATKAAIRAGYSAKSAHVHSARLLANARISAAIAEGQKKRLDKLEITAERVLSEIASLAYANMDDYVTRTEDGLAHLDLNKISRDQMAAVQELTIDQVAGGSADGKRERVKRVRFKLADKGLNLERLGRHLKLFTERLELSADDALVQRLNAGRKRLAAKGEQTGME